MSTTINVTVGGDGLLDRSRQQMQANRFGKLELELDSKITTEISRQKPVGQNDTIGRRLDQRRLEQEPGANKKNKDFFRFVPDGSVSAPQAIVDQYSYNRRALHTSFIRTKKFPQRTLGFREGPYFFITEAYEVDAGNGGLASTYAEVVLKDKRKALRQYVTGNQYSPTDFGGTSYANIDNMAFLARTLLGLTESPRDYIRNRDLVPETYIDISLPAKRCTIEFWLKVEGDADSGSFSLSTTGGGYLFVVGRDIVTLSSSLAGTPAPIELREFYSWRNVKMVFRQAEQETLSLYLDNQLVITAPYTPSQVIDCISTIYLSSQWEDSGGRDADYITSYLSDLRIYTR